ncbi:MAG: hypothetical protein QMB08_03250 [Acidimicrobiales bacterium]|jgi:hypothetical protein
MNVVPPADVVEGSLFGPERLPYGFTFLTPDAANPRQDIALDEKPTHIGIRRATLC